MLVQGVNDHVESLQAVATFVAELHPAVAYVAVPTRPPCEPWVRMPDEKVLHQAYQIFAEHVEKVEYLIGFSEDVFQTAGNVEKELLDITSVHPMREGEALAVLARAGADRSVLDKLVDNGFLLPVTHEGNRFFIRRFSSATPKLAVTGSCSKT